MLSCQALNHFERLDNITASNAPSLLEVGHKPTKERFLGRYRGGITKLEKVEDIGRRFIEEVVKKRRTPWTWRRGSRGELLKNWRGIVDTFRTLLAAPSADLRSALEAAAR
jgi:hypothetical protein